MEDFKLELQTAFGDALLAIGEGKESSDVIPSLNATVASVFDQIKEANNGLVAASDVAVLNTDIEAKQASIDDLTAQLQVAKDLTASTKTELTETVAKVTDLESKAETVNAELETVKAANANLLKGFEKVPRETVAKILEGKVTGENKQGSFASYQERRDSFIKES